MECAIIDSTIISASTEYKARRRRPDIDRISHGVRSTEYLVMLKLVNGYFWLGPSTKLAGHVW